MNLLLLSVVNRLIVIFALSISMICVAAEPTKKEATVQHTWQDWNSTPTPSDGRRVEDYYPFGEYYCTDENTYIRIEFELGAEPNDAWLVFYSYLNLVNAREKSFVHEIYVNSTPVYTYPKQGQTYELQDLAVVPASGLRKGKNVLWAKTAWSSIKLIVNGADGSQMVVNLSPAWRSSNKKHPGWEQPDYKGPSSELICRLGTEGYHGNGLPNMCHPYAGLIELKQDKDIPVYKAGEKTKWTVSIPTPFYGYGNPELEYAVEQCFDEQGARIKGKGNLVESKDGRNVYEMAFTVPPVGAHDVTIRFGGMPAMVRKEELVATGSVAQPLVAEARNLISSLDLTKIDEVDCTDTGDKVHCLIQGHLKGKEPGGKVVTHKGMTYFETGPAPGRLAGAPDNADYAMWKITAKDLNEWHLVEVDIPDDKDRVQIVALVHNIAMREYPVESTIELGNPRPSTDKIYTHRMLFIPKFHDVRVMVAPSLPGPEKSPAAVKAVRLYKINGALPAVRLGDSGRRSSTYNERSNLVAISFFPGSEGINRFSGAQTFASSQYRRWFLAVERHVEYLRFSGHNAVCHGIYQYTKEEYPAGKGQTDYISIMLDMYNANGIDFYCNVEYCTSSALEGKADIGHKIEKMKVTDEEVAAGKDTCRMVSNEGKQAGRFYPFNSPSHPDLKKDILRIVDQIGKRYGAHPGFKGVMFFAGTMGCAIDFGNDQSVRPGNPEWGFEDCTYNLFRSTVRKDAPDFNGPQRFADRYKWINENSRAEWEKFRCGQVYLLFNSISASLKSYSPQSKLLVNVCAWPWHDNIGGGSVEELNKRLIGTGTDVNLYINDPDMLVMHNEWDGQACYTTKKESKFAERCNNDGKIWRYVTGGKPCAVFLWTGFYEMTLYFPREMSNPVWYDAAVASKYGVNIEKRFIGSAGRAGRNYLSPYATAFAYADPVFFANRFTDVAEHRGFEDVRAEAGQVLSFIPRGNYVVQPGSTNILVLKRSGDNAYVVNNSPTAVKTRLVATASGFFRPVVRNAVTDRNLSLERLNGTFFSSGNDYACDIELMPYQIISLVLDGAQETKIQSLAVRSSIP